MNIILNLLKFPYSAIHYTGSYVLETLQNIMISVHSYIRHQENNKFITDKNHIPHVNIIELSVINPNYSEDIQAIEYDLSQRRHIYDLKKYIQLKLENIYLDNSHSTHPEKKLANEEQLFEEYKSDKIFVEFKLNNNVYFLCINDISNFKKIDHVKKSNLSRRIISATLIDLSGKKEDVLGVVNKYHGPDYNFYNNLSGVSNKFEDIFIDYNLACYNTLIIDDLFGETHIYDINIKNFIEWRPHL